MSKKDEYRKHQAKVKRTTNIIIISAIVIVALIVVGIIIAPSLKPVGNVILPDLVTPPQANGLSVGDPNAPVKVEVYSDFQCPACKQFSETTEKQIINDFVASGKVYLTYKNFPFIGPESDTAAAAGYCAADQNKFWEYHDVLFANWTGENVGDFSERRLKAYAEKISLDTAAFNKCVDSGKYNEQVKADKAEGDMNKIGFTPSVLVNGNLVINGDYMDKINAAVAGN